MALALAPAANLAPGPDVLARARAGDREAFADLVRMHERLVFSLALHVLRDAAAAEDVAQEVFLQLFRNLEGIESPAHVVFWLRRVTAHRAIDAARRRSVQASVPLDAAPEAASAPRGDRDPWLERRLRQLVATLPAAPRAVLVLRYQEDLEPGEIASVLQMPLNTVKSHLRRSLAVLRERAARVLEPRR